MLGRISGAIVGWRIKIEPGRRFQRPRPQVIVARSPANSVPVGRRPLNRIGTGFGRRRGAGQFATRVRRFDVEPDDPGRGRPDAQPSRTSVSIQVDALFRLYTGVPSTTGGLVRRRSAGHRRALPEAPPRRLPPVVIDPRSIRPVADRPPLRLLRGRIEAWEHEVVGSRALAEQAEPGVFSTLKRWNVYTFNVYSPGGSR